MLDLNQIALFVQVVAVGSFAKASRQLAISPATLSRQIALLEDTLRARLLHRSTRKLTLTDAGRTLFDRCSTQIDDLRTASVELLDNDRLPKGNFRVAAPANFFDFFQMIWVAEFLKRYPLVKIEFVLSDAMADMVAEGIDVAFRGSGELPDSSLVARKLATTHLVLAASPDYLAARGVPSRVEDLQQHDCICSSAARAGASVWRLNGPQGWSEVNVKGPFNANTSQAQRAAALSGLGICLLPIGSLEPWFQNRSLIHVLPGVATAPGGLFVVYPSRRHVPRAVTAFVEMCVQHISGLNVQMSEMTHSATALRTPR
jgi:DNA-binding transcriptional LysR family regulator